MFGRIRREFQWSRFGLTYNRPADFSIGSWQSDGQISGFFVLYRCAVAALFLSILVTGGSTTTYPEHYFIYFTIQGFLIQTIHLVLSAALPIHHLIVSQNKDGYNNKRMIWMTKISWFLYNVINVTAPVISFIYWVLLYEPGVYEGAVFVTDFMLHGVNTIVAVLDLFISKRPCRILHMHHPFVIFLAYVAFTAIYWAAGGRTETGSSYIYSVLNWEDLGFTVPFVCIGLFVAIPIFQLILWGIHQLRDFCCRRCCGVRKSSVTPSVIIGTSSGPQPRLAKYWD